MTQKAAIFGNSVKKITEKGGGKNNRDAADSSEQIDP